MNCTTVGVTAEFENSGVNALYTFNQDGSKSLALNSYVSVCYNGVCYNGGTGFNMNTYTGSSLSRSAGVCFGASSDACAGFELGQGLSWDRSGGFVGMTVYAEVYAAFAGGRSSYGYEQGFFGAEGRGMYAGISGYGLHAEVSQNGGTSWGFEERLYSGIGNNSSSLAADGTTASMVKWELWMPTLGNLGHFTFGNGYDVSSEGIRKKELGEIKSMLQNSLDPEDIAVVDRLNFFLEEGNEKEKITTRDFLRIGRALRRNGFEPVERMGDHSDGASKFTLRKAGSREYGQHEFMSKVMKDEAYCSYNYGNNFITHFLIDYLGWKGRGY